MKKDKKSKKADKATKKSKKAKRKMPKGDAHPASKITDAKIEKMRAKYETGKYTQADLAKTFGLSLPYTNRILKGHAR